MEMNMVAALCCVAVYFATICASTPPILNCRCTKVTETLRMIKHLQNLHNYTKEPQLCSPMAIRFVTVKGKIICSDPGSFWTQKAMKYLDGIGIKTTTPSMPTTKLFTPSTTSFVQTSTSTESTSTSKTPTSPTIQTPKSSKLTTTSTSTETDSTSTTIQTPTSSKPTTTSTNTPTSSLPTTPTTMTTSTVTKRSPVLHTGKMNWIKKRQNRRKKPGLRAKQRKHNSKP